MLREVLAGWDEGGDCEWEHTAEDGESGWGRLGDVREGRYVHPGYEAYRVSFCFWSSLALGCLGANGWLLGFKEDMLGR